MAAQWAFMVGPWNGGIDRHLTKARDRNVTFRCSSAGKSEASFTIDGRHEQAAAIHELVSDLHVFRRARPGVRRDRLHRFRIGKTSDKVTRTEHAVSVPALDYRSVLERRALLTGSKQSWEATDDLGTVALGLLGEAQNKIGGNYDIVPGVATTLGVAAGKREFKLGDYIGSKIQELSESTVGFDWDVTADLDPNSLAMRLDMWSPQRGVDRGVVLQFGRSVVEFDRDVDPSAYANAIRATGTAPDGSQTTPPPHERYAANLSTAPEGRWDKVYGTDVTTTDGLGARSDWLRDQAQVVQPTYTLRLAPGFWQGPGHIWLGDPVRWVARSGPRIDVDVILRVQEIPINIGDDGDEDVRLTIGPARPDYRRRASDVEQRLSTLERR